MNLKSIIVTSLLALSLGSLAADDVPVAKGPFENTWESLAEWECPEWFKDAKFGIWAHWGPQCAAEDGDWYGRFMYADGWSQQEWHREHFGDPSEFGLKDLCNAWTADNWDPQALVDLYKSVGARYFFTLGQHHDNFDLWDSPYQPWNSVNLGPRRDIVGEWAEACRKADLPLGVSIHGSHTWTWLELAQAYDGNLTAEDGIGKWWEGLDPQDLYAQRHTPSQGYMTPSSIHNQWDWDNGASLPDRAFMMKLQNRVLQCIDAYSPSMIYFDDTVLPFYGCNDTIGLNMLQHYYNRRIQATGTADVVAMGKQLNDSQKAAMLWDVERGVPDKIQERYWQTCTCLGDWHYSRSLYERSGYKSAAQVIAMLVDIVSKNGNMLLNVPMRSDGTIDDKERAILADIKAWIDVNGSSIYGTRPWLVFGEGPLAEGSNPLKDQGFNERDNYTARDVRYVRKDATLYATILRWPAESTFTFGALGSQSPHFQGHVNSIQLLGYDGDIATEITPEGLTVTIPAESVNAICPVFAITFTAD